MEKGEKGKRKGEGVWRDGEEKEVIKNKSPEILNFSCIYFIVDECALIKQN